MQSSTGSASLGAHLESRDAAPRSFPVTHEYTILVRARILAGGDQPDAEAIGWAAGTIMALGSDDEVRAISRGDSHFVDLGGAFVIPLAPGAEPRWPPDAALEIGGAADLAVLRDDPRPSGDHVPDPRVLTMAVIRGGAVESGALPGSHEHPSPVDDQRG